MKPKAVFFDVDFTLIYPGPMFQAEGYRALCSRHGVEVDAAQFASAVARATRLLANDAREFIYDPQVFIDFTNAVIRGMGGAGSGVDACSRVIYDEWAACQHFSLYDDVPEALHTLHAAGILIGLISNTHRCLASFQSHFELEGLIAAAVSSSEHGYMKPHRSIFEAGLKLLGVDDPAEAVMVGDSPLHDIEGARRAGMRAVLVSRSGPIEPPAADVPVVTSLRELPQALGIKH
ncbi:MAG: HAD family hydrolase [Vicinamibacterales bacterium]